jgi:hypothetical protein
MLKVKELFEPVTLISEVRKYALWQKLYVVLDKSLF